MNATESTDSPNFEILFHCDCCGRELDPEKDVTEFQESLHIHFHTHEESKYLPPRSLVECVLCQYCVSVILGRWVRITPANGDEMPMGDLPMYYALMEKILEEEGNGNDEFQF